MTDEYSSHFAAIDRLTKISSGPPAAVAGRQDVKSKILLQMLSDCEPVDCNKLLAGLRAWCFEAEEGPTWFTLEFIDEHEEEEKDQAAEVSAFLDNLPEHVNEHHRRQELARQIEEKFTWENVLSCAQPESLLATLDSLNISLSVLCVDDGYRGGADWKGTSYEADGYSPAEAVVKLLILLQVGVDVPLL